MNFSSHILKAWFIFRREEALHTASTWVEAISRVAIGIRNFLLMLEKENKKTIRSSWVKFYLLFLGGGAVVLRNFIYICFMFRFGPRIYNGEF